MTTLRMVQLANDKFAIQKQKSLWGTWKFCEAKLDQCTPEYGRTWYSGCPDMVMKYCVVDTESEAEVALEKTVQVLKDKAKKHIKIIRVIRKVKL